MTSTKADKQTRKAARAIEAARKSAEKQARKTDAQDRKSAEKQARKTDKQNRKQVPVDKVARKTAEKNHEIQAPIAEQPDETQRGNSPRAWRMYKHFKGSRRIYAAGIVLLGFKAATTVAGLYLIAYLIDFLTDSKSTLRELGGPEILQSVRTETIAGLVLGVALIAAITSAIHSLSEIFMRRAGHASSLRIRAAMFDRIQRLPLGYHRSEHTDDVLNRITRDVLVTEEFVVKSVHTIVGSLTLLVASIALLGFLSWPVAVATVLALPLLALVSRRNALRPDLAAETQLRTEAELDSTTQETMRSIRLAQTHGSGTVDLDIFSSQEAENSRASANVLKRHAWLNFGTAIVDSLAVSAAVVLTVWLIDRDEVTIGNLVLIILLLQTTFSATRRIVSERREIGTMHDSVERIEDLLNRPVPVAQLAYAVEAPELHGELTFRDVTFTYPASHGDHPPGPDQPVVLEDLDFEVAAQEVVALAGASGSGKTTVAQLLLRFYDPDAGEVLVDGMPIRSLTVPSLRKQFGLVLNDTVIQPGSIAENIAYGIESPTPESIEAAARLAAAHEFIIKLPDGYQTSLAASGSTLTHSQRQLIAIARAFMRSTPILILDDPTKDLDAESAKVVTDALGPLIQGRTTLVISSDPGLLQHVDRVVTIDDNRIAESAPAKDTQPIPVTPPQVADTDTKSAASAMPTEPEVPAEDHPPLFKALQGSLSGLATASDPVLVAEQIDQQLLNADSAVESVEVGKIWMRDDGTCSLHYQLRLRNADGEISEHLVLGRVTANDDDASQYVKDQIQPLIAQQSGVLGPWRESSAIAAGSGLVLHPFPIDPALPTLIPAMDPAVVLNMLEPVGFNEPPAAKLISHSHDGGSLVRYRFPGKELIGKIYGDDSGVAIAEILKTLTLGPGGTDLTAPLRFPRPIMYSAALKLLITERPPGRAAIPALLKSVLADEETHSHQTDETRRSALRDAVSASADALALLHSSSTPTPLRSSDVDLAELRLELDVIARLWPEIADDLRERAGSLVWDAPVVANSVLSHGDFSPSHVLIDGGTAAIIQLDSLCRADPALDIGCFLADLSVLASTLGGTTARPLIDDLSQMFVDRYSEAASGPSAGAERIDFHRELALIRVAVHACRQANDRALALALSLLNHE